MYYKYNSELFNILNIIKMNFKIYGIIIAITSIASLIECKCIIKNETSVTTNGSEVIPIGVGAGSGFELFHLTAELISLFGGFIQTPGGGSEGVASWGDLCWHRGIWFTMLSIPCKNGLQCKGDWWTNTNFCR